MLPTFAATAWYHHKLASQPADLQGFLQEVEQFAMGDYAHALDQGANLPEDQFNAIAEKLHDYTGLPVAYIKKANLRINGPQFEQELADRFGPDHRQARHALLRSRPWTRWRRRREYDPQSAAIGSAYVSVFNDYVRRALHLHHRRVVPARRSTSSNGGNSSISHRERPSRCQCRST